MVTSVVVTSSVVDVDASVDDGAPVTTCVVPPPVSASTAPVIDRNATKLRPSIVPGLVSQSFALIA